jgi:thiamine pyrophosphate-dependent acetolactate synthase large subunit-like protein
MAEKRSIERRKFLKSGMLAGAAAFVQPVAPAVQPASQQADVPATERDAPTQIDVLTTDDRCGSDYMVDVIKSLGFEYVCANPGSSFRGMQESILNYGGNKNPEFITNCHEESAVAMGHGYYKMEGKPMAVLAHGTVGLQHASMAIYNAWCDRVPVYIMLGNYVDAAIRRPAEWYHGVQDCAGMVRDYTKWDDQPASLIHFGESAVRAYKIAMTPPMAPVVLVLDAGLQESPIENKAKIPIPKLTLPAPPQGEAAAVAELARLLVNASNPVLVADRLSRTPAAMPLLIELAETLQAAVIDQGSRMNFPSLHPLNQTQRAAAAIAEADVIVGLEVADFWATVNALRDQLHRSTRKLTRTDAKLVTITAGDLYIKSNYQDFRRLTEVDLAIAADGEATLPSLIEAVKRSMTSDRKRVLQQRGTKLAEAGQSTRERFRQEASYAWNASPVSTARVAAELWSVIKNEDWSLVSNYYSEAGAWPRRLWDFNKPYHWPGHAGGGGIGYGAPSSIGAALANKKYGRFSVSLQTDGDLMYAPGVLWTAAHHRIPLLSVMLNNRGYHQELMHVQKMCNERNRGIDRGTMGSTLTNPNIDFAKVAQGLGLHAEGPITDPRDLGQALRRAAESVKRGEPALVDVVIQPR